MSPARLSCLLAMLCWGAGAVSAAPLRAGVAKVDITHPEADAGSNPLFAKALVLSDGTTHAAVVSIDAVAIAEIGSIRDPYLETVRSRLEAELKIAPGNVLINASHCHGVVCKDVAERTIQAVRAAWQKLDPVKAGAGVGREDRIMVNRRLILKSGKQADVRHAYSMPPDDEVAAVGPVDPEIGVLRLDRLDGRPLALVYNFACHPIQGIPSGGNTADLTGFASTVIEENLGEGAIALFVQGCAGDINPALYKAVDRPRDAETFGNLLGLSALKAARAVESRENAALAVANEPLILPRADQGPRIASLEAEIDTLVDSLNGTTLNLKTFLPLYVKYRTSGDFPSYYPDAYLQDEKLGRGDWKKLDETNRKNMEAYIRNIRIMEELTRKQINLALLKRHQTRNAAAGKTIEVEVGGLRVGDFRLITFPGELTVQIGLNIKSAAPNETTFVAGYTNGYIYYAPTEQQLLNIGGAQEDSDCLLAPGWQALFEERAAKILEEMR